MMNRLEELTVKLLDQTIDDDEIGELIELNRTQEGQECVLALLKLEADLLSSKPSSVADSVVTQLRNERLDRVEAGVMRAVTGTQTFDGISADRSDRRSHLRVAATLFGFAALAACIAFVFLRDDLGKNREEAVIATFTSRDSAIKVLDTNGIDRRVAASNESQRIRLNETIVTSSAVDTVEVFYKDGTKLELLGETRVRFARTIAGAKELTILSGLVQADVAPQPRGRPLRIITDAATLEVLGTTLGVEVKRSSTQLGVATGRVAMTRKADGQRVEVGAGHFATATESTSEPLQSRPFPDLPLEWSEDFDNGLPVGWRSGELVVVDEAKNPAGPAESSLHQGSSPGPRHAVRSTRSENGKFVVTSHNAWQEGGHGLCMLNENSTLHLRIRQSLESRIEVMIGTRVYPPKKGQAGGNLFYVKKAGNEASPAGIWRTLSIPLKDVSWQVQRGQRENGPVDLSGLATYLIHLSTDQKNAGLTIDRIWITDGMEQTQ